MLLDLFDLAQWTSLAWNKSTTDENLLIHLYKKNQLKYYCWNSIWISLLPLKKTPLRTKYN